MESRICFAASDIWYLRSSIDFESWNLLNIFGGIKLKIRPSNNFIIAADFHLHLFNIKVPIASEQNAMYTALYFSIIFSIFL